MIKYDYIIVGCGFYGAVMAERLHHKRKRVLILERRDHIGGNCYSYEFEGTNITVHKYGTHIFHTSNKRVWDYITQFGEFNRYRHRVLTTYKGKVYSMPINLATINAFYDLNLKPSEVADFITSKGRHTGKPNNFEEKAISQIGVDLYNAFIKGYTAKQWGCAARELPAEIITRLPVRTSYNDCYFDDYYQGLPKEGYTALFKRMLKGVPVEMETDFFDRRDFWLGRCHRIIYTGPIDRYFDYSLGRLKWRSVRFETRLFTMHDYQGTSQMNYADEDVPFTRIHEPKHLHLEKSYDEEATVVMFEYPQINNDDPYYPVNADSDKKKLLGYKHLAIKERKVIFGGRLAEYKYFNMDEVIENALKRSHNA
jgi:UDP-galactopyranose mutase